HEIVRSMKQIRILEIDLALAAGRNFVVMTLDVDSYLAEYKRDRITDIDQGINGSARDVALFGPDMKTEIRVVETSLASAVPMAFFGIDRVTRGPLVIMKPSFVKNE